SIIAISLARFSTSSGDGAPSPLPCSVIFPGRGCEGSFITISANARTPCSQYTLDYRLEACNTSGKNCVRAFEHVNKEHFIQLEDGAVVAFEEYGDANGVPVIFCHGWPSSRTMARLTDEPARELGIRIVSPDRPVICGSSLQRNRKLSYWPRLLEQVVERLDLPEFRMLAISGGAPYAYATATAMPERVRAIAIVGGAPPIAEITDGEGLLPLYRWMLALY